ncbi:RNA-directed DNA polymerase from mobile element jockey [Eumeta japonica]|uniref:RNA-directed DNA polymerase from mobile element jockey n=1 Tax=Eumeta variegata TaxID=151549 RepID=A0A4C1WXR0_EUMVA|nr:RNA-directed DNA polymerase from mobile element jockey [Eumeta japonica]
MILPEDLTDGQTDYVINLQRHLRYLACHRSKECRYIMKGLPEQLGSAFRSLDVHSETSAKWPAPNTAGATDLDASTADGSPACNTSRPGPNHSAATSTTPQPRRAPADIRVVYWNAGGIAVTPEVASHHAQVVRQVQEFLMAPMPPLPGDYFVSLAETVKMIARLPKRKAPGSDRYYNTASALRTSSPWPRRAMVTMTRLFNGIIRTGHFPEKWKMGRVIAIPKAGTNPRLTTRQRPIMMLSYIAKLFERIALQRLHRHLTPSREQFGFRSGHSTTLQLTRALHHNAAEHNRGHRTVAAFLDIEKAFDGVWHPGLLYKMLRNTQIPPALVRTVASFLEGRSFFVAVEDATSDPRPIHAADWEKDIVLALYADDNAYLSSSHRADLAVAKLQRVLDLLPDWLDKWRVAVNITKTAARLTGQ